MNDLPAGIPAYQHHRLRFQAEGPLRLPTHSGPAWRGALGKALRGLVCLFRTQRCQGCILAANCAYQRCFESALPDPVGRGVTTHAPHPFVLHVRGDRHRQDLHLTLLDAALTHRPALFLALQKAAEAGIGHPRNRLRLTLIEQARNGTWHTIHRPGERIHPIDSPPATPPLPAGPLRIHLASPLRLVHRGRLVRPSHLTPRILLHALYARLRKLNRAYGRGEPPYWPAVPEDARFLEADLRWLDFERYSHRQRKTHPMGGITGHLTLGLEGLEGAWPALWHGQFLHLGKHTAMGHGAYRLDPLP